MKTRPFRIAAVAALVVAALSLTACFEGERVSWSADGRYLAFVGADDKALWVQDTRTGETKRLAGGTEGAKDIVCVRFLPSGTKLLYGEQEGSDEKGAAFLHLIDAVDPDGGRRLDIPKKAARHSIEFSDDGQYLYFLEPVEDRKDEYRLIEYQLPSHGKAGGTAILRGEADDPGFFASVDSSRKRVLFTQEAGLILFSRDDVTTRLLLAASDENVIFWPKWIDAKRFVFVRQAKRPNSDAGFVGNLVAGSVDDPTTRLLCSAVYVIAPIALSPDRRTITVTRAMDWQRNEPKEFQVAVVDFESGKTILETNEPFYAAYGALDPSGKRLAFVVPAGGDDDGLTPVVLDVESGRKRYVWRNEEERLFAAAEDFAAEGDAMQSLASCRDLLARFPDSRLKEAVQYRMLRLYLAGPLLDLDNAYGVLEDMGATQLDESDRISREMIGLFWPEECRIATDPADDWITTYTTEAARKEFQYDPERTRDLRGLWARAGKDRLYVRVDYGSNQDLRGLTFQDTLLLFGSSQADSLDAVSSTPSTSPTLLSAPSTSSTLSTSSAPFRRVSDVADWDRPIERSVLVRHWYESGGQSQYDLEIRDDKGEIASRFLASGFSPPANPLFEIPVHIQKRVDNGSREGSVVYAISRDVLGLRDSREVAIQAGTFKGGIESVRGLERPRESLASSGGRPYCDVADAFGPDNTRERIESDLKAAAKTPGARVVIRGAAGTFSIPKGGR